MGFKIPKFFSFGLPFIALGSPIAITVPRQLFTESPTMYHYFFRLPLFSSENKSKHNLLNEDKNRLREYYKKYYNYHTSINSISEFGTQKMEGEGQPNLFIQVQRKDYVEGREWEWLKTIKLNQLTIDRWFEKKISDTDLLNEDDRYKELIQTDNLLPEYIKLTRNALNQDAIDIYFKKAHIPTSEIKRLVYVPSEQIGQKNWYVWWDKELLRLKLNFGFHIWFFNQKALNKYRFVRNYYHRSSQERKKLQQQLNTLYKSLTQEEKNFFEFYFQEIWINKTNNQDYDSAVLNSMEFSSKDLNIIYNKLSEKSKHLEIFKGHLIQVLKGGDREAFESFFPNHINYASGLDAVHELKGGEGYQPNIKLTITPDRLLDKDWSVPIILDWIKYYSIRNFTLRVKDNNKEQWPAIIFNSTSSSEFPVIRENYLAEPIAQI